MSSAIPSIFFESSKLTPDDERIPQMTAYIEALLTENTIHNLTGITNLDQIWKRHILEAIMLERFIPAEKPLIDVGSGGGIPGIPLAIMRPDLHITLLEATGKKAAFLTRVTEQLNLNNLTVENRRAEDAGQLFFLREQFDFATCKALGALPEILELCIPLLKVGGHFLAIKGKRAQAEMQQAQQALTTLNAQFLSNQPLIPSDPTSESRVLDIIKKETTPDKYPRRSGMPKKRPIGN